MLERSVARWIRADAAALLIVALWVVTATHSSWMWFLILFLAPDLSMIGYVFGPRVGVKNALKAVNRVAWSDDAKLGIPRIRATSTGSSDARWIAALRLSIGIHRCVSAQVINRIARTSDSTSCAMSIAWRDAPDHRTRIVSDL